MEGKIFLSYRRNDSSGYAHAIYNSLIELFGQEQLVFDVDSIEPGIDFVEFIEGALSSCEVLLVLIGRNWLEDKDLAGRKIEDPSDLVRVEIVTALRRNIRVIPLLIDGAQMPKKEDLPDELLPLLRRNAIEITNNRFKSDIDVLARSLKKLLDVPLEASPPSNVINKDAVPGTELSLSPNESLVEGCFPAINKFQASEILHRRLADTSVRIVKIISYTNEVEAGSINRYSVQGPKKIEIYKRSILSEQADQQLVNLKRLMAGSSVKYWDKKSKSYSASEVLEKEFEGSQNVEVNQYYYEGAPTKRAYVFDDREAVISYYQTPDDPLLSDGSLYKGISDSPFIHVDDTTSLGRFFLDELRHFARAVRLTGRTWAEELELLSRRTFGSRSVCIDPAAVFLDLDGVVYDSLPFYVRAWTEGFKAAGIEIPEEEVYLQEGRSGRKTVELVFQKHLERPANKTDVQIVLDVKHKILNDLGKPPIMDGVKELLTEISSTQLPVYIVTGSTKDGLLTHLEEDFGELFPAEKVITGNDVTYGKPSPEPYFIACERAKVLPSSAIVIENAPLGIESAVRCGAFCIAVNTGPLSHNSLASRGCSNVFDSCLHLSSLWRDFVKILKM